MCGIIGVFHTGDKKEAVNQIVLDQFEDQQERGTKGFGIIKIDDKRNYKLDRATEGYKFMYDIHQDPVRCMIVHHRQPTSSDNKLAQTHPIVVDNGSLRYKYLFVHNGIIYNEDDVKKEHEKLGFIYTTVDNSGALEKFNDSETLAIDVARFIEKQIETISAKGSAAFIALQIERKSDKVVKLFFGRNSNPLHMSKTRNIMTLSSAGKGDDIEPLFLYECHLDDKMKLSKRKMTFPPDPVSSYAGAGYTSSQYSAPSTLPLGHKHFRPTTTTIKPKARVYDQALQCWRDEDDCDDDGRLTQFGKDRFMDVDDDEPYDELVERVSDCDEAIQSDLDNFYDMLYDPTNAEEIVENDVEMLISQIKTELQDVIADMKQKHLALALAKDSAKEPITDHSVP
jgi:predicted glutamine amidotransferase